MDGWMYTGNVSYYCRGKGGGKEQSGAGKKGGKNRRDVLVSGGGFGWSTTPVDKSDMAVILMG